MVRPLLSFRQSRRGNLQFDRQAYSYSGHLNLRGKKDIRGKRGEYSAPASMRTSPTNSGLLVPPATSPTSSSDSTMEELQAAIQAAIAHCKKSIQVEDKLKCQD
nr:BRI1 kinase inhibitor 1-like [Ipomoea batatas]